jgi:hypothetical protein
MAELRPRRSQALGPPWPSAARDAAREKAGAPGIRTTFETGLETEHYVVLGFNSLRFVNTRSTVLS